MTQKRNLLVIRSSFSFPSWLLSFYRCYSVENKLSTPSTRSRFAWLRVAPLSSLLNGAALRKVKAFDRNNIDLKIWDNAEDSRGLKKKTKRS